MFFPLGFDTFIQGIFTIGIVFCFLCGIVTIVNYLFTSERFCWLFRRKLHEDEYGILWVVPNPHNPSSYMRIVEVNDSCGTYYKYVPRHIVRAKQGVAWTYNQDEHAFHPTRV